ncbi:TPA: hypothetical protein DF272_05995 [Candidatus Falkowbacteria bacterium]|nr:hypothetical protein [Candidatus Falkowbacteria bacterium]
MLRHYYDWNAYEFRPINFAVGAIQEALLNFQKTPSRKNQIFTSFQGVGLKRTGQREVNKLTSRTVT